MEALTREINNKERAFVLPKSGEGLDSLPAPLYNPS